MVQRQEHILIKAQVQVWDRTQKKVISMSWYKGKYWHAKWWNKWTAPEGHSLWCMSTNAWSLQSGPYLSHQYLKSWLVLQTVEVASWALSHLSFFLKYYEILRCKIKVFLSKMAIDVSIFYFLTFALLLFLLWLFLLLWFWTCSSCTGTISWIEQIIPCKQEVFMGSCKTWTWTFTCTLTKWSISCLLYYVTPTPT